VSLVVSSPLLYCIYNLDWRGEGTYYPLVSCLLPVPGLLFQRAHFYHGAFLRPKCLYIPAS
jgi:hypothetical protein